ncbi:MAG: hypothetical protein JXR36_11420 [Bacteroidales bacterium]|nr:hypothetical protein [Bacteroidales bacterium]
MKKINLLILVLLGINILVFGQYKTPEWYYKQIPPIPDSLNCSSQYEVEKVYAHLETLVEELDTIIAIMNMDVINLTESQMQEQLGTFPTNEELDKLASMSEEEQQKYGEEIDARMNNSNILREEKIKLYQDEKSQLDMSFKKYWDGFEKVRKEHIDIAQIAGDAKFEKNQEVRRNIDGGDEATAIRFEKALEKNRVEYCESVSQSALAVLRYQWENIEEFTRIVKRNNAIEFMSVYYLSEDDINGQFSSITQIVDYEVLRNYIKDYMETITGSLPGSLSNR